MEVGGGNKKSRREGRRQSKSGKNERGRGVNGPTAGGGEMLGE